MLEIHVNLHVACKWNYKKGMYTFVAILARSVAFWSHNRVDNFKITAVGRELS